MNKCIKLITFIFITLNVSALVHTETENDFPISGPNCHDTALRHLGLKNTKRYIHNHEMKRFLKERCEVTEYSGPSGEDQLGIIELVDTGEPMHGFVSLKDGKVLTKDGVLKRTLPKISTYEKMTSIHKQAILTNCRLKKIAPCNIEIKYYNCMYVDISLKTLENVFTELTSTKYSFYNLELRNEFTSVLKSEDFSESCEKKKEEYHSMILAFRLANMSSRSKEEQIAGEAFFKENLKYLKSLHCL